MLIFFVFQINNVSQWWISKVFDRFIVDLQLIFV